MISFNMLFQFGMYLFTNGMRPYLSVSKLFAFSSSADHDFLCVWFSGNIYGWNLSLKLPEGIFT